MAQRVKNPPAMWEMRLRSLGWEDPLEEGIATHSSILNWRIPMDKGAWWATVHRVTSSGTWLKWLRTHTHWMNEYYTYIPWNSPGQNTEVGSLSLLQGIFPTKGLNSGLPHCRQILYQLSHKRSLSILEWVAYPFSSRSSQPRNWTSLSCITGGFFTNWAIREALNVRPDSIKLSEENIGSNLLGGF